MENESSPKSSHKTVRNPPKKGGIRGAFENLLQKLGEYWEVMLLYVQKNFQEILRTVLLRTFFAFVSLFLLFFGLAYLSFGLFYFLQKNLDPGMAGLVLGLGFMVLSFTLVWGASFRK